MSNPCKLASELLPLIAEAFPHTFFAKPSQVRPLKINIHQDLLAALPDGIKPSQVGRFLYWYVHRPAYQRALAEGKGRVDLTGAVVEMKSLSLSASRPGNAGSRFRSPGGTPELPTRPEPIRAITTAPHTAAQPLPINLEDLYAMAIDAKLEVTLKFTTLPNAKPAGQGKMAFALKTPDGQFVTVEVSNKVWSKLQQANTIWPSWIAALSGTMGEHTVQGFTLANPGLQVFERKPRVPAEVASSLAEALSAALTAANPAEITPAPVVPAVNPTMADPAGQRSPLSLKKRGVS